MGRPTASVTAWSLEFSPPLVRPMRRPRPPFQAPRRRMSRSPEIIGKSAALRIRRSIVRQLDRPGAVSEEIVLSLASRHTAVNHEKAKSRYYLQLHQAPTTQNELTTRRKYCKNFWLRSNFRVAVEMSLVESGSAYTASAVAKGSF